MNEQDRRDLQRWLDGALDAHGRATFEQLLETDPELRAEVALHERVAESLQRSFAVPQIANPVPTQPAQPRWWPPFLLGVAGAAAVLLAWLQPWNSPGAAAPDPNVVEIMRTAVGRSWLAVCGRQEPVSSQVACSSPGELPEYVRSLAPELPSPLAWRDQPGVRFERGLESTPNDGLRVLALVVLPSTEVFLFVVPTTADPRPELPDGTDWNLFREARGPLVVYELTPLDQPYGLQCLTDTQ